MNNIFNIKRLGLVFKKDLQENGKRYMLLFITMLGIITIFNTSYAISNYRDSQESINEQLLLISSLMYAAFGLLFASTFMTPMNSKIKRITYLVNPSSNFEKYLTRWIIVTVIYSISFFIALWVAEILRVAICTVRYPEVEMAFLDFNKLVSTGNDNGSFGYVFHKSQLLPSISIYLLLQSLFVLGSTFWEKATFIKTFTAIVLIAASFILICRWTILLSYGDLEGLEDALNSLDSINRNNINQEQILSFFSLIISVFTLTNWALAFFRFRESEIIKRL